MTRISRRARAMSPRQRWRSTSTQPSIATGRSWKGSRRRTRRVERRCARRRYSNVCRRTAPEDPVDRTLADIDITVADLESVLSDFIAFPASQPRNRMALGHGRPPAYLMLGNTKLAVAAVSSLPHPADE